MPKLHRPEPGHPKLVAIGEQILEYRLTLGAMKHLDIEHGINLLKKDVLSDLTPEKLALVLYYGLKSKQPTITLEWLEDQIDYPMLPELVTSLGHAITPDKSTAEVEPENPLPQPEPDPDTVLTGSPSGPSLAAISDSANGKSGG